ncbi:MAG: DNA-binding protein [Lachnospiraceae bacterium]|nr:DNA-binding protein [Lachnospiraceae bacterium]
MNETVRSDNRSVLRCGDVMEILGVSDGKAYGIIRQLNKELEAKGFHTITGRVSRQYFEESFYGITAAKEAI